MKVYLLRYDDIYANDGECSCSNWETLGVYSSKALAEASKVDHCSRWGEHTHRLDIEEIEMDKNTY